MKRFVVLFLLLLLSCMAFTLATGAAQSTAEDPAMEARLRNLSQELRCLVCQNETLAESRAELADDLRREIREQMKAGRSDQEIIAFLTQRYGDFVLYRPRVRPVTYLLWFGPFVLLVGGMLVLYRYVKQRRDSISEKPLTAAERRRAEDLLESAPGKEIA